MLARYMTALLLALATTFPVMGAATHTVLITEFVASNDTGLIDEDGNHSDWLELHNPGAAPVNLDGWYLTDKENKPTKWRLPAVTIAPKGFVIVFCSGKDRAVPGEPLHASFKLGAKGDYLGLIHPDGVTVSCEYAPVYPPQQSDVSYGMVFRDTTTTLIGPGASATAFIPTDDALGALWTQPAFDDADWCAGTIGVGIVGDTGYERLIDLDVANMRGVNSTAYIRIPFDLESLPSLTALTLRMKYDDGFWAYLNGALVASANTPAEASWDASALAERDPAMATQWHDFDITPGLSALQPGPNVLAIHGLNHGADSENFLILPEVAGVGEGVAVPGKRAYFGTPTPGAPNIGGMSEGPAIADVSHTPAVPNAGDDLLVEARVTPTLNPVQGALLYYRVNYGETVSVSMVAQSDGLYQAVIPASAFSAGQMVRYYIVATDEDDNTTRHPAFLNPEASPEYLGTMVADPAVVTQLPVLYWWVESPSAANTEIGTRASVFYLDEFYDNVLCRRRGSTSAYYPKKSYKFEFNKGFDLTWDPDQPVVDEINVNTTHSDKSYIRQVLAWETYEAAGVPGVHAFPVRVQQNGAFFSVANWIEHPDKNFLERIGLDKNGAFYKMYNPFTNAILGENMVEKKTRKEEDAGDLEAVIAGVQLASDDLTRFMFDNINVPESINYVAATAIMQDTDHSAKNYFAYRDTEGTAEWQMLPWDKDLTFGRVYAVPGGVLNDVIRADINPNYGTGNNFINALFIEPTIRQMYLRRLRTLMDTLLQPPGTPYSERRFERRLDDLTALIAPDVELDRARWGNPYGEDQDLLTAMDIMKTQYLEPRREYLFIANSTPGNKRIPGPQAAAPPLAFGEVHEASGGENPDEEYIQIVNPTDDAVDVSGWTLGGDASMTFAPGVVVPARGAVYVSPNVNAFRARASAPTGGMGLFVQGNYTGRVTGGSGHLTLTTDTGILIAPAPYDTTDVLRALSIAAGLTEATPRDLARLNLAASGNSADAVDMEDAIALSLLLNTAAND